MQARVRRNWVLGKCMTATRRCAHVQARTRTGAHLVTARVVTHPAAPVAKNAVNSSSAASTRSRHPAASDDGNNSSDSTEDAANEEGPVTHVRKRPSISDATKQRWAMLLTCGDKGQRCRVTMEARDCSWVRSPQYQAQDVWISDPRPRPRGTGCCSSSFFRPCVEGF